MSTHRVTSEDFDLLIKRWERLLAGTPRGTKKYRRVLAKLSALKAFGTEEYGEE